MTTLLRKSALVFSFVALCLPLLSQWTEVQKLLATPGAEGDKFGFSVDIDGDIAVSGAYEEATTATNAGAAYVYQQNNGGTDNWGQVLQLLAPDGELNDRFGYAVSVSGNLIAVGAPWDADNGSQSGSVYIFSKDAGGPDNWGFVQKIKPGDGMMGDAFGYSISLNGSTLLVGAYFDDDNGSNSGSAYVFYKDLGGVDNWGEAEKIIASDGASNDHFGISVSLSGNSALIGARFDDDNGSNSGSAYVFDKNEGGVDNWGEVEKLISNDGANLDQFGISVSLSGDVALIGCHLDDNMGFSSGSAYFFYRNDGGANNWGQVQKITASDHQMDDQFGLSVSLDGDTAVVGAHQEDEFISNSGAAYKYARNEGGTDNWGELQKLKASDNAMSDYFGIQVAISGENALIGAWANDDNGDESGSAYIFGPEPAGIEGCMDGTACNYDPAATSDDGSCLYADGCTCPGDFNGDNLVNTLDLLFFLAQFGCAGTECLADFNDDNETNTTDLLSMLALFGTDCE
jgi:hypothetical protein